jgi:hypothetical protein
MIDVLTVISDMNLSHDYLGMVVGSVGPSLVVWFASCSR